MVVAINKLAVKATVDNYGCLFTNKSFYSMLTNRTSPQTNVTNITKVTTQLTVTLPDSIRSDPGDESDESNRPGR